MSTFNLETATEEELLDEILRITIIDYHKLRAKMSSTQMTAEQRELFDGLVEKYKDDQKLLDSYFERLEDMFKDSPPGELEKKLKDKQLLMLQNTKNT